MIDVDRIAEEADVIIGGFAVLKGDGIYRVVNLNRRRGVAVMGGDGALVETDMNPIELSIARRTLLDALAYMEA